MYKAIYRGAITLPMTCIGAQFVTFIMEIIFLTNQP